MKKVAIGEPILAASFSLETGQVAVATSDNTFILSEYRIVDVLPGACTHLSWSPNNALALGHSSSLKVYSDSVLTPLLPPVPFRDLIQDVAYDAIDGKYLASLSDDQLLRIYTDSEWIILPLVSRGNHIEFHAKVPNHLLLSEENGAIRLLNIETRTWVFTLLIPSIHFNWNPIDPNLFSVLKSNEWAVYDLSQSLKPVQSGKAHGLLAFKWSRRPSKAFAISTSEGSFLYKNYLKKMNSDLNIKRLIKGFSWSDNDVLLAWTYDAFYFWAD